MILILFVIVHSLSIFGSHTVNVWILLESICRLFCDVWHNYERLRWLVCPCLILSSILHEFIFRNRFDCSLLASAFRASYNSSGWLIFLLWILSFSFVRPRAWCCLWAIGLGGYRKLDDTCFVLGRGLWCLIGILVGDNNKWLYSHSVRGYTAFMLTVWQGLWVLLRRILRYWNWACCIFLGFLESLFCAAGQGCLFTLLVGRLRSVYHDKAAWISAVVTRSIIDVSTALTTFLKTFSLLFLLCLCTRSSPFRAFTRSRLFRLSILFSLAVVTHEWEVLNVDDLTLNISIDIC